MNFPNLKLSGSKASSKRLSKSFQQSCISLPPFFTNFSLSFTSCCPVQCCVCQDFSIEAYLEVTSEKPNLPLACNPWMTNQTYIKGSSIWAFASNKNRKPIIHNSWKQIDADPLKNFCLSTAGARKLFHQFWLLPLFSFLWSVAFSAFNWIIREISLRKNFHHLLRLINHDIFSFPPGKNFH